MLGPSSRSGGYTVRSRSVGWLQRIVASERTDASDAQLGIVLTFVAGAINAGGFLAVGQYTSHMSGIVSVMADSLALGALGVVVAGTGAVVPFIAGAACSAVLINWGRRNHHSSPYAAPLGLEALLLLGFGLLGFALRNGAAFGLTAVTLLCFIMGLQNATITKISGARIRTTHVTGIITDIGIELGKLVYWNRERTLAGRPPVVADLRKLRLLGALLGSFFSGGVIGALGYQRMGLSASILLAMPLLILTAPSFVKDMLKALRRRR
jgi:uncharacterized membrane protein YoaK (UPF0700 family)